jgi:hypothetical protein
MQKLRDAKAERRDKTYGTLEAFSDFLERFTPPAGGFDPRGEWKQSYAIRLFADETGIVGFLEIERRKAADGVVLTVATRIAQSNGFEEQRATLACAADRLASLRSVEFEGVSGTPDGTLVPTTKISGSGVVGAGKIEWTRAGRKRSVPAPPPVVANWGLFDAVQRLAPREQDAIGFTLLDHGDLVKPGHRLVYAGETSVRVADGAALPLHCWEQTGYGTLPAHYWVDANGRLLFAISGQKAFLYDPNARQNARTVRGGARRKCA